MENTREALKYTVLLTTLTAGTGIASQIKEVHADVVSEQQETNNKSAQDQYKEAQTDANTQLQNKADANTKAENDLAQQNASANAQDATKTNDQIAEQQQQIDQIKAETEKQNADQLTQKEASVNQATQEKTAQENTSYQNAVNTQTQTNQSAESQMASQNDQKLADANQNITTPAQKQTMTDEANANAQKQTDQANATFDQASQTAKQAQTDALNKANAGQSDAQKQAEQAKQDAIAKQQEANKNAIAKAQQGLDDAIKNAPTVSTAVTPAQPINDPSQLTDQGYVYYEPEAGHKTKHVYKMSVMGAYGQLLNTNQGALFNSTANIVSSENQLPLDFKPGILVYDGAHDTSEKIAETGLTEEQKLKLNDLSNQWMNSLRNYFWNVLQPQNKYGDKFKVNFKTPNGQTKLNQLITPKIYQQTVLKAIELERNLSKIGYQHTLKQNVQDPDSISDELQKNGSFMNQFSDYYDVMGSFDNSFIKGDYVDGTTSAENMYKINGSTMLEMEISLYNRMQNMLWGEYMVDQNGNYTIDGHLQSVLDPEMEFAGMTFNNQGNGYIVTWDLLGIEGTSTANGNADDLFVDALKPEYRGLATSGIIDQIKAAQTGTTHKDMNAQSIKDARQNLANVKAQTQKDLQKVQNADYAVDFNYDAQVKAANDNYNKAINDAKTQLNKQLDQIKSDLNTKLAQIKALPENTNDLKAQLDKQLADLKQADAKKLDDLKAQHEANLQKIQDDAKTELQNYKDQLDAQADTKDQEAKIADLKAKHEAFVKANADKLAQLKAKDAQEYAQLKSQLDSQLAELHKQLFPEGTNGKDVVNGHTDDFTTNDGTHVILPGHHDSSSETNDVPSDTPSTTPSDEPSDVTVPSNTDPAGVTSVPSETIVQTAARPTKPSEVLPQTGNDNKGAFLISALGIALAMFGFGVVAKKRY